MALFRKHRGALLAIGAVCTLGLAGVPAQAREVPGSPSIEAATKLAPNSFIWDDSAVVPAVDGGGELRVIVSIADQRAYVYRAGALIAVSTVSTGAPGHETPTGEFPILQKDITHRSNKYSNAPMPFMQRLTWDGVALHAGHNPGYAASHGCIRLPLAFARKLYGVTNLGVQVLVTEDPIDLVAPESAPLQIALRLPPMQQYPTQTEASGSGNDVAAIRAALLSVRRSSSGASVDAMVALVY